MSSCPVLLQKGTSYVVSQSSVIELTVEDGECLLQPFVACDNNACSTHLREDSDWEDDKFTMQIVWHYRRPQSGDSRQGRDTP